MELNNTAKTETHEAVQCLRPDLGQAGSTLGLDEARYLVDAYFQIQDNRKASGKRIGTLVKASEAHGAQQWLFAQYEMLESQIRRVLSVWSDTIPAAKWANTIIGIGPVISAGLAAHIDISKCPTVGHIWRFAGLDPTVEWKNGEKRPWNASLKMLCGKMGESFVEVSGHDRDVYGKLYIQRKAFEQARNDAGSLADQAARKLDRFKIGKTTDAFNAYSAGRLPPAHIHARAKRWAVKLFLAHYHEVAWTLATKTAPPKPYVISILGHADYITPPNWEGAM
jgi:hypothetical protein